jgi:hypothetical protein
MIEIGRFAFQSISGLINDGIDHCVAVCFCFGYRSSCLQLLTRLHLQIGNSKRAGYHPMIMLATPKVL